MEFFLLFSMSVFFLILLIYGVYNLGFHRGQVKMEQRIVNGRDTGVKHQENKTWKLPDEDVREFLKNTDDTGGFLVKEKELRSFVEKMVNRELSKKEYKHGRMWIC